MPKIQSSAARLAWRRATQLHFVSPSRCVIQKLIALVILLGLSTLAQAGLWDSWNDGTGFTPAQRTDWKDNWGDFGSIPEAIVEAQDWCKTTTHYVDLINDCTLKGDEPITIWHAGTGAGYFNVDIYMNRNNGFGGGVRVRWYLDSNDNDDCGAGNVIGSEGHSCVPEEYYVEEPTQCGGCQDVGASPISNESNPISAADGNKFEVEVDWVGGGEIGLEFVRYYNSSGPYKTAFQMPVGWRHTYSRRINEKPDKDPAVGFISTAKQSSNYSTPSSACTSGWSDIKDDAFEGDLSTATASFSGGNTCKLVISGNTVAHIPIRFRHGSHSGFTNPTDTKVVVRPDGSSITFEYISGNWVAEFNPRVSLVQSGSYLYFTDENGTEEKYSLGGYLHEIKKRNGQVTTITYVQHEGVWVYDEIEGPFGHVIEFKYSGGLVTAIKPPDDVWIDFRMDGHTRKGSRLIEAENMDNTATEYLYEDEDLPHHLTGILDENDDRYATWEYDDAGRGIHSEHGTNKEEVDFTYNTNGTTTVDLGNGASRTYTFGVEQGRRKITDLSGDVCSDCLGGHIESRTYDSNGFLDEATDWNGNITKTARNSEGQVTTLTEADGSAVERQTTYTWHATHYGLPTQISRPNHDIDYTYDANGNPTEIEITDGVDSRVWAMTYNAHGQVLTVDGPQSGAGDKTTYTYYTCTTSGDECGQLKTVTDAEGNLTEFDAYDDSARLTQMTDPNGLVTTYTYNTNGLLTTIVQTPTVGTARTTTMTYWPTKLLKQVTLPNEMYLFYTYDDAHYLTKVNDNFVNYIEYDYDEMGNLEDEDIYDPLDTLKRANDYVYDLNRRLETVTNGGFDTDFIYDDVGNLTNVTDPELQDTEHSYDALNRLEETLDALGGYTDYTYDAHDNLTSVTAPNGAVTEYTYDNLDNLIEEDSPDRGVITYTHDDAGNVLSMTDARSKVTEYTYDDLNRLTEIELDNNDTITYEYDTGTYAKGKLNKITDPSGETTWTFNQFGQVTSKTQEIGAISLTVDYDYDTKGRLVTMTYPSGKEVDYTYDDHLPDSVTWDNTVTILSGATYDPFGPVNGWTWGNSTAHSRTFSTRGLLTSQKMVTDTRTLTHDDNGRVITLDDTRHDLGFDYNVLGQITDFTAAGSSALTAQDYTYDENGNRESLIQNSTTYNYTNTAYTNRLASTQGPTSKTMTYDAAGNITADGTHTYVYDDWGRLMSVNSSAVTYEHNGMGQRVKKDDGSDEALFVYDEAGQLIGEYDDTGAAILEHIWFNGAPVAVIDGLDEYYVHTDHLGTPRIITDGNTTIWRWESGPFGEEAAQEDPDGDTTDFTYNLRFPGQYYDVETGTHYNYYRTYDPSTGRYLESDPIGLDGGLSTYGYVYQNPLSWIDPLGLDVTINITRTGHTSNSNTGVITATSDVTGDAYVGDFLENRNPPNPNLPTPPGSYKAFVDKRQGRKDRVELLNVPNATDIQIHVGNSLADLEGCFAPGTATGTPDWVSNSGVAMDKILDIIANDGTGNIDVNIYNNDPNP